MNYQKIYDDLISFRYQNPPINVYSEKHHIIPRSMGGSNDNENLVVLTAREHFIAHLLLVRIHKDTPQYFKTVKALVMMSCMSENQQRYSSRRFAKVRELHSKVQSIKMKGSGNVTFGKCWVKNDSLKKNKLINRDDFLDVGWTYGRTSYKSKDLKIQRRKKRDEEKTKRLNAEKETAIELYTEFVAGNYFSLRDFAKSGPWTKSHVSLIKFFKKHVDEFSAIHGKPYSRALALANTANY